MSIRLPSGRRSRSIPSRASTMPSCSIQH